MSKKIIWIVIAIIVVLLLIWAFNKGSNETDNGNNTQTGESSGGANNPVGQAIDNSLVGETDDVDLGELI